MVQATLLSGNSWTLDTVHDATVLMLDSTQCGTGVQMETHEVSLSTTWLSVGRWGQAEGETQGGGGRGAGRAGRPCRLSRVEDDGRQWGFSHLLIPLEFQSGVQRRGLCAQKELQGHNVTYTAVS